MTQKLVSMVWLLWQQLHVALARTTYSSTNEQQLSVAMVVVMVAMVVVATVVCCHDYVVAMVL